MVDKNYDDLKKLSSNTFAAAKIHDPTDSGCMLKTILPNVSEADGDLILVDGDTKTDTYSPVTKNYPDGQMLIDIADIADSCVIIEANGKCHLDDDLASGDALDFDTAADKLVMIHPPKINDILDTLNYFEIFGAINPDTGERFNKIVDNSGTDKKRRWRCTNNNFRSQADVDAYATKLSTKLIPVREISIGTQGLKAHNMGTTFTYKHVDGTYNVPSAAYYVIEEAIDMDTGAATIKLSDGVIESSKYAAGFEWAQNYSDSFASEIYETDIITVYPNPRADTVSGASIDVYGRIQLDGNGDSMLWTAYLDDKIDSTLPMTLTIVYFRVDTDGDTITGNSTVVAIATSGVSTSESVINDNTAWEACATGQTRKMQYTLPAANISPEDYIGGNFQMLEAGKDIRISVVSLRYYIKRSLS